MRATCLFDASISDVLDESRHPTSGSQDALFGQGIIGTYAGPRDPGTAAVKLDALRRRGASVTAPSGGTCAAAWAW